MRKNIFSFCDLLNICNEKGNKLEFTKFSHLIDLYGCKAPQIVVKKSAQVGITQAFLTKLLFWAREKKITAIYTMPTDGDVTQFSQARFNPILEKSYIQNIDIDNVGYKRIGESNIYFKGSFSEAQAISVPADIICHDELDFSKPDIISMYSERLGASLLKWQWTFSTPTISEYGIDALYRLSTQTEFVITCQHCNKEQVLNYFDNVICKENIAEYVCCGCKKEIDRSRGRWVEKYPGKNIKGYHITKLIVPFISAMDLVNAEQKAKRENRMKQFYNFALGECYSGGVDVLHRDIILQQIREEQMEISGQNTYIGVDQGDELHIVVSRRESNYRRIIYTEKATSFDRIGQLINQFGVCLCCIDALPNKHPAKKIRDDFKGRVYLVYYKDSEEYIRESKEEFSIAVDRTESLDRSANSYITGETIINNLGELKEEFVKQMCGMKKDREENKYGEIKEVWRKIGADHWRHADNYNYIAFNMRVQQTENIVLPTIQFIDNVKYSEEREYFLGVAINYNNYFYILIDDLRCVLLSGQESDVMKCIEKIVEISKRYDCLVIMQKELEFFDTMLRERDIRWVRVGESEQQQGEKTLKNNLLLGNIKFAKGSIEGEINQFFPALSLCVLYSGHNFNAIFLK